jgi:NAD(P)-dependent dehydrogenase (short-subunit alcohol dehydrogenase family)
VPEVLVTGATSGVGRWLAAHLGGLGATVLVHGRDPGKVAATAAEVRAAGGTAREYVADLSVLAEVRALAERIDSLDVLVNNAGVGGLVAGRELSADGYEMHWAVNYLAPVALTRGLLDVLRRTGSARVVNVGSVGQAPPDLDDPRMDGGYDPQEAYARSKLALAAWTFDLAGELAGTGITANVIHPATYMDTAMVRAAGIAPASAVEDGASAVLRLVTDTALARVTGRFFDGRREARAHRLAYDAGFRARLAAATARQLATR